LYAERAAIQEHLGGMTHDEAEAAAFEQYKPEAKRVAEQRWLDL